MNSETSHWRYAASPHALVEPIPAFQDNYFWLVRAPAGPACAVVDPGDAEPVQRALAEHGLRLEAILLTHHHPDHVGGVEALVHAHQPVVYGPAAEGTEHVQHRLGGGDTLELAAIGLRARVLDVPGHTRGHIAYVAEPLGDDPRPLLFCGDTLFAAGCGRLFEGTPAQMLDSLERLAALPDETLVFCAHEYTLSNLRFARAVTPDDAAVAAREAVAKRMRQSGLPTVPSTIVIERDTNPFMRARDASVHAAVAEHTGQAGLDPVATFAALREWKNRFR
ncbi:MAG: hydroxyacylglutathione hydrolase [Burkholderiales bacterium]|nr:MAG: hydroxyacylglutathione hydrolase [Burkholderiales bacterium]